MFSLPARVIIHAQVSPASSRFSSFNGRVYFFPIEIHVNRDDMLFCFLEWIMSPTILRVGSIRFFFNSREELRKHVHVQTPDGVAKFWLEPIISLDHFHGLNNKRLNELQDLVKKHEKVFIRAWEKHFSK